MKTEADISIPHSFSVEGCCVGTVWSAFWAAILWVAGIPFWDVPLLLSVGAWLHTITLKMDWKLKQARDKARSVRVSA